jgi:hypothetical protein
MLEEKKELNPKNQPTPFSYDMNLPGEVMTDVRLYDAPVKTILDYLDGDIYPISKESKITSRKSHYAQFKLFNRGLHDLLNNEAAFIANLILRAERRDVEEALMLIKKKPILLHITTEARDPLGRRVKGTLLQIAAMAGDVDLRPDIKKEKDKGLVERLISLGHFTKEEIAQQLECITSREAKKINHERNQRVINAVIQFGKDLEGGNINALHIDNSEVITQGYIFDPKILQKCLGWFNQSKLDEEEGCSLNPLRYVFLIQGYGKLQSLLSSRDAQVVNAGISAFSSDCTPPYQIPARSFKNADGATYFFNVNSRLGIDFYIHHSGFTNRGDEEFEWLLKYDYMRNTFKELIANKNRSIKKLRQYSRESLCLMM